MVDMADFEGANGNLREDRDLIVVGIGASAGGLEALQHFFDNLGAGTAMAFVVAFLAIKAFSRNTQSIPEMMALPLPNPMAQALPAPTPARVSIRDRVHTGIEGQPDVAARVVRAWLKEGCRPGEEK